MTNPNGRKGGVVGAAHRAYVLRETLVAVVINALLSLVFSLLAAHGRAAIPLWGANGMAVDFGPQLFMMTFATTLAVTLLTRKRLRAGQVAPCLARTLPAPRNAILRAVVLGIAAVLVFGPLSVAALYAAGVITASTGLFIAGKVAYGAVVSLLIAPPITLAALKLDTGLALTDGNA